MIPTSSECTTKTIDLRRRWGSVTLALSIFSTFSICMYSWIPYTTKTDTQGYRAGLADAMLSHLMTSHILIQKLTNQSVCFIRIHHNNSPSLTCILYTSILTFTHFSCFKHIYNNYTFTVYHLAWEFKKPFIISFIMLCFIQLKINELLCYFQVPWVEGVVVCPRVVCVPPLWVMSHRSSCLEWSGQWRKKTMQWRWAARQTVLFYVYVIKIIWVHCR